VVSITWEFSSIFGCESVDAAYGDGFRRISIPGTSGRPKKPLNIFTAMSRLSSLQVLLVHEIKDLYNAENQLVKALPKMAKAATDPALQEAFNTHLEETKVHVERLEEIAKLLEESPKGKVCKAMEGLVEEGAQTIEDTGDASVKDLALIIAAQKVEHYEMAGYGSARTLAETLGLTDIAEILQTTLDEEGATDQILTDLAESIIPDAPDEEEE